MRFSDDDDTSDSNSDEPSHSVLSWRNSNTILQTKMVAVKNNTNAHKHFSYDMHNQRSGRRERSPLSVCSARSYQQSIRLPNFSRLPNNSFVDHTRGASPMSFRSVSNIGSIRSTEDVKSALESYLKNCKKEDIYSLMRIIKRRLPKKRTKIKKLRSLTKGAHVRYGGDSGDHCSDSSNSSRDSRSSRSSLNVHRNANFSIQNQSKRLNRLNRRNHDNRPLRSMMTASMSNSAHFEASHIIGNDVNSFQARDYDARSNIDSGSSYRMPIDDDVRSVRTLPSTSKSCNRFKNMFSLEPKPNANTQISTHNFYSKSVNENPLRQNTSMWSLKTFDRSVSEFPSESKGKGIGYSNDELFCSNKSTFNKSHSIKKHITIDNDKNIIQNNYYDDNIADTRNAFRTSNRHNEDNRSVRSEPCLFKSNNPLSKSKTSSKNSLDIVPRSMINVSSYNEPINNLPSTSKSRYSSKNNFSRLTKTFNNLSRVPPIEEKDENDNVSDEPSLTTNCTDLIENRDNFRITNNMDAREKKISDLGKNKDVHVEQNENLLNDNDNVSVKSMPLVFKYNSSLSLKPLANIKNVFTVKMKPFYNNSLENRALNDLTSRSNNEASSGTMRAANNSISKLFVDDLDSDSGKEKLLASSGTAIAKSKNKNKYSNTDSDSDDENIILYKSNINVKEQIDNSNDKRKPNTQHNVRSESHQQMKSQTKLINDFIFAKPKTPQTRFKCKPKNNTIHHEKSAHKEAKFCKSTDDQPNQNTHQIVTSKRHEPSEEKIVDNFLFMKPKTPGPQNKGKSKNNAKCSKNQPDQVPKISNLSHNMCELTQHSINDVSLRPSFIRRKLFTQTLEITENGQNDSFESLPQSPICNIYSTKPNDHKAHRSLLPKSLLRVDIDDGDLQRNQSNMSQLVQKIVPQNRISALTQNLQTSHNLGDDQDSEDDGCDVMSIMSMHNRDDISDTYSDTGSDKVNENLNNNVDFNKQQNKVCRVQLLELKTQQSNCSMKKTNNKPGIRAENCNLPQPNARPNISLNKKSENVRRNVLKTHTISSKLKPVKNQIDHINKTSETKEMVKTRRKRSLAELNDSDALGSQSKRPKRSCNTSMANNGITPSEKKCANSGYHTKKSITRTPRQKSKKDLNVAKSKKEIDSNVKLNNSNNNCKINNAIINERRVTRSSLNISAAESSGRTPKEVNRQEPKTKMGHKTQQRGKSSEDVTTSRKTRQSLLHGSKESLRTNNTIQKHNESEIYNNKKRKADVSNYQNAVLTAHGLGIVKSRFDIVPKHCSKQCIGCDSDNKSIVSTSTIITRSRHKTFINAF